MAVKRNTWQTILIVAAIALAIAMLALGYAIGWAVAIVMLVLALAGGAFLSRRYGPPSR